MALFYFEAPMGCGLREARDLESARNSILREVGTYNKPTKVQPATDENIRWVAAMGGWVPDATRKRLGLPHKGKLIR